MTALLNPRMWAYAALFVLILAVLGFVYRAGGASARSDLAAYKLSQQEARILADRAATIATTKALNDAHAETVAAESAAASASNAAGRLRERLAAFTKANPAGSGAGVQGADPLGVLIDVLERHDDALQSIAAYADKLKVAGLACERISDGVAPTDAPTMRQKLSNK